MSGIRNRNYHIYAIIFVALAFNYFTIRGGHSWNGDFALYVKHAENIASGQPYGDVGYVYNPHAAMISPNAYPPVYPAFLVPVYRVFGLDIHAFKVAGLAVFGLFLVAFHRYTLARLPSPVSRVVVMLAVAFSPWIWAIKDQVLPDFLFMLFGMLAILAIDHRKEQLPAIASWVAPGLLAGLLVYLAYGTRSLGLMLIPALIVYDLVRFRTVSRLSIVCVAVFAVLYLMQNAYLSTDQSYFNAYLDYLTGGKERAPAEAVAGSVEAVNAAGPGLQAFLADSLARFVDNIDYYHNNLLFYWDNNTSILAEIFIYVCLSLLAVIGFLSVVFTRPSSGHYYLVFYILVLLAVPFRQDRYLLPLIPLYFIYMLNGAEKLSEWLSTSTDLRRRVLLSLQLCVFLAVAFSYLGKYYGSDFTDFRSGVNKPETRELFDYVRNETPEDSLFVFREPRIFALYCDRRSVIYYWPEEFDELTSYFRKAGVTHVVSQNESAGLYIEDRYLAEWVEANRDSLIPDFKNSDFTVYRFPPD